MTVRIPCGKTHHHFNIWFKCGGCKVEKEFTIYRRCQANDTSTVLGTPMEMKKFHCKRCQEEYGLSMIFYCQAGHYDHDEKWYESYEDDGEGYYLQIHLDNIDEK